MQYSRSKAASRCECQTKSLFRRLTNNMMLTGNYDQPVTSGLRTAFAPKQTRRHVLLSTCFLFSSTSLSLGLASAEFPGRMSAC